MPEFTLRIDGMHCGSCVRRVSQALAGTDGLQVKEVRVGAARIPPIRIRADGSALAALAKAGYTAQLDPDSDSNSSRRGTRVGGPATESLTLPVLGMTCASCQHHVEEALRSTAGVESAHVDLMAHRASVVFNPLAAPEHWLRPFAAPDTTRCFPAPRIRQPAAMNTTASPRSKPSPCWLRARRHAAGHAARHRMGALTTR